MLTFIASNVDAFSHVCFTSPSFFILLYLIVIFYDGATTIQWGWNQLYG